VAPPDDRRLPEGKTPREAIGALKRRLSDIVWRHLLGDAQAPRKLTSGPRAGHSRNVCVACVAGSHLNTCSSAQSPSRP
jgi:hypothetical protein